LLDGENLHGTLSKEIGNVTGSCIQKAANDVHVKGRQTGAVEE